MILGKLPGYEWWPGVVVYQANTKDKECHQECERESGKDEEDEEDEEEEGAMVWAKWFGDNQLSKVRMVVHDCYLLRLLSCVLYSNLQLPVCKLVPFEMLCSRLVTAKLKGLYRKAVMAALKVHSSQIGLID